MGSAGQSGTHDVARAKGPGLVVGRSGASFGKVHFCAEDYWPLNTALFATDFLGNDPRFACYALKSLDFSAFNSGSAQPSLNRNYIAGVRLAIPPVKDQGRIAWILGNLDDKIESNRRLAATLEATVAALFQARFVQFVGQDDLVESELGRIPRGWRVGSLDELGEVHRDIVKGESPLPYIGLDAMPRGSTVLGDWASSDDAPRGTSARFKAGDILFGKLRPYFRKVGIAPLDGRCSTEVLVLNPRDEPYYGFLFGLVSSQRFIDHCQAVSRGTRMPRAEWKDAGTYQIAVPPASAVGEFSAMVRVSYAKIAALIHENYTLAALRDGLLPRLVTGELRVAEAEEVVAEAA